MKDLDHYLNPPAEVQVRAQGGAAVLAMFRRQHAKQQRARAEAGAGTETETSEE